MRLAVISDTHGNAIAFEAIIQDLKRQSPDAVVFLGDMVMRGPQPVECIEMVRDLNPLAIIRGNYEDIFNKLPNPNWTPKHYKEELILRAFEYDANLISKQDQEWLANLPTGHSCLFENIPTEMYHASHDSLVHIVYPWAPLEALDTLHQDEATKLVLYGHIHHAHVRQGNGRLVVNCGSIGLPFDGDNRASYAIIDMHQRDIAVQLRRVTYDIDKAIQLAKDLQMPDVDAFEYALRLAQYPYDSPKILPVTS